MRYPARMYHCRSTVSEPRRTRSTFPRWARTGEKQVRGLVANCRETMQNSYRCRGVREVVYTAIIFTAILMAMFTRRLQLPERSLFLLGPRGAGKTTW